MARLRLLIFPLMLSLLFITQTLNAAAPQKGLQQLLARLDQYGEVLPATGMTITSQAQKLGDAGAIIEFVQTRIAFQSYNGFQRGPLGTLMSEAGNEADKAGLLAALLKAQKIPCQLTWGQTVEPDGRTVKRVWVRVRTGDQWENVFSDGSVRPNARAGRKWLPDQSPPPQLRCSVRLSLKSRFKTNGRAQVVESLAIELDPARLYLTPIYLFNRLSVDSKGQSPLVRAVQPILVVGAREIAGVVTGAQGQKDKGHSPASAAGRLGSLFENLDQKPAPKKSSLKTNAGPVNIISQWLQIKTRVPGAPVQNSRYTLVPEVFQKQSAQARIRRLSAMAAFVFSPAALTRAAHEQAIQEALPKVGPFARTLAETPAGSSRSPAQLEAMGHEFESFRGSLAHLMALTFVLRSDQVLARTADHDAAAYHQRPRAIAAGVALNPDTGAMRLDLDLIANQVAVTAPPKSGPNWGRTYRLVRGLFEAELEGRVLAAFATRPGMTIGQVLAAAQAQSIPLTSLTPETRKNLKQLKTDPRSRKLINRALQQGRTVIAPQGPVLIKGHPRYAWYEYTPDSGHIDAVFDSGRRQGMAEYMENMSQGVVMGISECMGHFLSLEVGYVFGAVSAWSRFLDCQIAQPTAPCYQQGLVCAAAFEDAKILCQIWGNLGSFVNDILAISQSTWYLALWPDYMRGKLAPTCDIGAMLGLNAMGCDLNLTPSSN